MRAQTPSQPAGAAPGVDPALAAAVAAELVALTTSLGDLAFDLGSHPETLRRHMAALQSVDAVTQALVELADVLRSAAPVADRLSGLRLECLAARIATAYDVHGKADFSDDVLLSPNQ